MHFPQVLVGAAALLFSSVLGGQIPTTDVDAHSELEARNYRSGSYNLNQCQREMNKYHDYKFCRAFYPTKTVIAKKFVVRKKGTKTIYNTTKYASCTAATGRALKNHGRRDTEADIYDADAEAWFAKREAEANPDAIAEADAEARYSGNKKCRRKGVPYALQKKYSCKTIKQACKRRYRRNTRTKTETFTRYKPQKTVYKCKTLTPPCPPASSTAAPVTPTASVATTTSSSKPDTTIESVASSTESTIESVASSTETTIESVTSSTESTTGSATLSTDTVAEPETLTLIPAPTTTTTIEPTTTATPSPTCSAGNTNGFVVTCEQAINVGVPVRKRQSSNLISTTPGNSVLECTASCRATAGCIAFNFLRAAGGGCQLFNDISAGFTATPLVDSGVNEDFTTTTVPIGPTTTTADSVESTTESLTSDTATVGGPETLTTISDSTTAVVPIGTTTTIADSESSTESSTSSSDTVAGPETSTTTFDSTTSTAPVETTTAVADSSTTSEEIATSTATVSSTIESTTESETTTTEAIAESETLTTSSDSTSAVVSVETSTTTAETTSTEESTTIPSPSTEESTGITSTEESTTIPSTSTEESTGTTTSDESAATSSTTTEETSTSLSSTTEDTTTSASTTTDQPTTMGGPTTTEETTSTGTTTEETTTATATVGASCAELSSKGEVTASNGVRFETVCDDDNSALGTPLDETYRTRNSFQECLELCAVWDGFQDCRAFTFFPKTNQCLLKSGTEGPGGNVSSDGDSGIRIRRRRPTTTTTTTEESTTTTTMDESTTATDGSTTTTTSASATATPACVSYQAENGDKAKASNGKVFSVTCSTVSVGLPFDNGPIPNSSVEECLEACAMADATSTTPYECAAWTWEESTKDCMLWIHVEATAPSDDATTGLFLYGPGKEEESTFTTTTTTESSTTTTESSTTMTEESTTESITTSDVSSSTTTSESSTTLIEESTEQSTTTTTMSETTTATDDSTTTTTSASATSVEPSCPTGSNFILQATVNEFFATNAPSFGTNSRVRFDSTTTTSNAKQYRFLFDENSVCRLVTADPLQQRVYIYGGGEYTDGNVYSVFLRDPSTPSGLDGIEEAELTCTNQGDTLSCAPVGAPDFSALCLNRASSGAELYLSKDCSAGLTASEFRLMRAPPP